MKYQPLNSGRIPAKGWAMFAKNAKFEPYSFDRHAIGENDILIDIKFAGICHSDIHTAKSEWGEAAYPCVPGHEIAGEVIAVGSGVTKFKVGDLAGVGCMVNSCGECEPCQKSFQQFCEKGAIFTYNSLDRFHNDEITKGGYSNNIVVSEKFAIKVPAGAPLDKVAPLLCAGITTYSPIKFSGVKAGSKVAVAGFGGLGMMAVKYAIALNADVSIIARNDKKRDDALKMGAKHLYTMDSLNSVDERFDLIISTIPTAYDPMRLAALLKMGGELAIVGMPPYEVMPQIAISSLIYNGNKRVYGSMIGGIDETQEMLDFSIKNKIWPETEIIAPNEINEAWEKLLNGSAKFRYVIDMSRL